MSSHLSHEAFVYDSDEQYVVGTEQFLTGGLAAGDAVVVSSTGDRLELLSEALGPDRARVRMINVDRFYSHPARTVATFYHLLTGQLAAAPRVRLVSEVRYGSTADEWAQWGAYEAICTRAFSELPARVMCAYDARKMPDAVAENVWSTHLHVLTDRWMRSSSFEAPDETVRRLSPEPAPLADLRPLAGIRNLAGFLETMAAELAALGLSRERRFDIMTAAPELASNAIEHGGGIKRVRTGMVDGRFVCEVMDAGQGFDNPLAGYLPPAHGDSTTQGLWLARQFAARIEFFPAAGGFTARLWR